MAEPESISLLSPTLDPKSPYYLDPEFTMEDNLSTVKLSIPVDNYFIWKREALESLGTRNKIGFVDGSVVRPDPSSPLYDAWEQCDEMVKCWLLNSVNRGLRFTVCIAETAHRAWNDLRLKFAASPELKVYEIRRRIAMMSQDKDSLAVFLRKLNLAWEELSEYDPVPECVCGRCRCEISKRIKDGRDRERKFGFLYKSNNDVSVKETLISALNEDWKIHQLRGIITMTRQKGRSLGVYFEEMNRAWLELSEYDPLPEECACDGCGCEVAKRAADAREEQKVFGFLMGLDDSELRSARILRIMLMKPPPTFSQAYTALLNWP